MEKDLFIDESQYMEIRLENQISWYSDKSDGYKKLYLRLQTVEIILASLIPVMAALTPVFECMKNVALVIMSLFGAAIAIIESICKMEKYHENWIQYRHISELLKHEKFLYLTKTTPYDSVDAFSILVERAERTISSENVNWVGLNTEKK